MNKTLIVILGPTGVGKTDVCLRVAEYFRIPIINADSRQIFREIPIGTAAPTPKQLQRVKHYMVANHQLTDYYSASMYEQDVLEILEKEFRSHDIALLSGGSMMYVDAVCKGIDDIPTVDDETRAWMKQRFEQEGLDALCEELRQLDPDYYAIVDKKNYRRVIHALEIIHCSGKTYTSFRTKTHKERPFKILKIGLTRDRNELYDRINRRVDKMMEEGLLEEARRMYPLRQLNALNTVGYKELFNYFDGIWPLEEAIERIKGNTRRYCRKQLTWYKNDENIKWFNPDNVEEIIKYIESLT
ncbi:MAG: tRNA (adenosine(37)-N6)-dimethylallyltransferase MiaA [Prevotella sp.]|nr:tRNA (adenosine(37)-N6)-dimethylallyltransferase MiaA [Prevotella sp.]